MTTGTPAWTAPDGSSELFEQLAAVVYAQGSYEEIYRSICVSAVALVDGCDHASLMLRQGDGFATVAASDDIAARVDEFERANGDGPCRDAMVDATPQLEADLSRAGQWPRLAGEVLRETPVRGVAGFRIVIEERKVGALNLFANVPGGLTDASVSQGVILASFASVALTAASRQESADTLAGALASNREIGKATGLMMAFHKVSDVAAFEILRKASQDMNVKLSDIARRLVDHHNSRP